MNYQYNWDITMANQEQLNATYEEGTRPRKPRPIITNPRALYESMDEVCDEYDKRLESYGKINTTKKRNKRKN
jgi:hypothetical protein